MMFSANDLNMDFLNRAERRTAFNINSRDFSSLEFKNEIRYLFHRYYFPNFDMTKLTKGANMNVLNALIKKLKQEDTQRFNDIYSYKNVSGIGPGEVLLYFLIDDAFLGGGSSAGADLIFIGGESYEVKAAQISTTGEASNFKLGGTVDLSRIISKIYDLRDSLKIDKGAKPNEIGVNTLNEMKKLAPKEYAAIESEYSDISQRYFGNKKIIFLKNNKSGSGENSKLTSDAGTVEAIKTVKKQDIMIHSLTSGTIKPKVKL